MHFVQQSWPLKNGYSLRQRDIFNLEENIWLLTHAVEIQSWRVELMGCHSQWYLHEILKCGDAIKIFFPIKVDDSSHCHQTIRSWTANTKNTKWYILIHSGTHNYLPWYSVPSPWGTSLGNHLRPHLRTQNSPKHIADYSPLQKPPHTVAHPQADTPRNPQKGEPRTIHRKWVEVARKKTQPTKSRNVAVSRFSSFQRIGQPSRAPLRPFM